MDNDLFLILLISHAAAIVMAAVLGYRSNPKVRDFCHLVWQQLNSATKLGTFAEYEMTLPQLLRDVVAPILYYYLPMLLVIAAGLWIMMR
ncbi:MAG: hypothetical protein AAFW74_07775 [Pseudomonadota bacterium]